MRIKSSATKPSNSKAIAKGKDYRASKRKQGEGSSKAFPADIMEPKSWDLAFMEKVEPVFVDMVEIQKWRSFLTDEDAIYPELVRQFYNTFRSTEEGWAVNINDIEYHFTIDTISITLDILNDWMLLEKTSTPFKLGFSLSELEVKLT